MYLNTGGIAGTSSPLDPANNGISGVERQLRSQLRQRDYDRDGNFPRGRRASIISRATAARCPRARPSIAGMLSTITSSTGRIRGGSTPRLTVTYGLRWVLEAPPYETNGYQVAPCVQAASGGCTNQNAADWFNQTGSLAASGQPANDAGEMSFILGGPKNNGPGLWNWDHKNFSPRIAVAWAPDTGDGWISKVLGKERSILSPRRLQHHVRPLRHSHRQQL